MASIASIREALAEVEKIKALTEQVKMVPGLAEGEIDNLYHRVNRILNSYSEMSRKQYRAFRRELDEFAENISDLFKDEKLSKKHVKIFDKILNKLKIRDFYSARRLLRRFDDFIALNEELNNSKEEYRRYYQGLENEIERLNARLDKVQKVPKPEMGPNDLKAVKDTIKGCNERVKRFMFDYIAGSPSHEVLRMMLWASKETDVEIPNPDNRAAAIELVNQLDFHEETRKAFGDKNLHALLEAMDFTDARFGHFLKDYKSFRRLLSDNITWLRGLSTAGGYSPNFSFDDEPDMIRDSITAWIEMLQKIPNSSHAIESLKKLSDTIESRIFMSAKENEQLYQSHGDLAHKAWDGKIDLLATEIEEKISKLHADKDRLPGPNEILD